MIYRCDQAGETITTGTEWSRVVRLAPDANISNVDLSAWSPASFITESISNVGKSGKNSYFQHPSTHIGT
jgi:hypothetical protein